MATKGLCGGRIRQNSGFGALCGDRADFAGRLAPGSIALALSPVQKGNGSEIDPEGYGLQDPASSPHGGARSIPGAFDRRASYERYQALLGDAAIWAVTRSRAGYLTVAAE